MEKIKYRVWDKEKKEFVSNFFITPEGNYGYKVVEALHVVAAIPEEHKNRFILLLYTGLKDVQGRMIFEGDILGVPNPRMRYEVKFGSYKSNDGYEDDQRGTGFYLEDKVEGINSLTDPSDYEALGNIYEGIKDEKQTPL